MFYECEFTCNYNCGKKFKYEERKKHFIDCKEVAIVMQACSFCHMSVETMPNGLTSHLRRECESQAMKCPRCKLNIYQLYYDRHQINQRVGHDCDRDRQDLVKLHSRFRQLEKFTFPFIIDKNHLRVIEMHGFCQNEISAFKEKAV